MPTEFFVQRPSVTPTIYAYVLPDVDGGTVVPVPVTLLTPFA